MAEYTSTGIENRARIKTPFAKIIVNNNPEKVYYNIMWWQDGEMQIGFGSYNLSFVKKWLSEEFEVNSPVADVAPVRHGKWVDLREDDMDYEWKCSSCGETFGMAHEDVSPYDVGLNYCPNCGCRMDLEG